ncbi:MAG TPA: HAD-IC family P-type ATPase [Rhodanobacteraceae bacterium]|nr:HAD-IC family P-type ATPase [Rhodanobacteraceae bacterium]
MRTRDAAVNIESPLPMASADRPGDRHLGLSHAEAQRRLAEHGPNALPGGEHKPLHRIVLKVLAEPMFMMLLVAGSIYLVLGDLAEAIFLLASIFLVIGITLVQERRTQRALEALRDLSAPRALVIRAGEKLRISGREVVPGDLLALHEGDRIAADATLLEGYLEVDESLLTGEAVAVGRLAGSDRDRVCASTVVTKGNALAQVSATGSATRVGEIGAMLATAGEPLSGLQRSSRGLIATLSVVGLLLAAGYSLLNWLWNGHTFLDSLLAGVALSMAILPEEIPVVITVFLAMGAWRLSRHNVLTRRIPAVEALGAITVLAADKTGTLTQNRMQVTALATPDGAIADTRPDAEAWTDAGRELVEHALLATPSDPFDPTEKAIVLLGQRLAALRQAHRGWTLVREYPLSSATLAMTRAYAAPGAAHHQLAVKGAPETIVALCRLSEVEAAVALRQASTLAARGLRVLGVAHGEWTGSTWPDSQQAFAFRFAGFLGFGDPPRPEVPAAIAECRSAGVRILMLTGDHPATAQAIAREIGMSWHPEVLTGPEMAGMDDAALRERLARVDVCARLRPEQKLRLVHLLQDAGDVVAMTGDGVNDAPALKTADVGVAMGERGTDVAREASALVLLDDSFASIVRAIRQGRRIYDNIGKATGFVFAVHAPIIALTLVPALLHWPVLLAPVHIVLLELLIDPACSMVFEAEPESADTMRRPPRPRKQTPFAPGRLARAILQGAGLAALLLAGCGVLLAQSAGVEQVRTLVFAGLLVGLYQLALANHGRSPGRTHPRNPRMKWILVGVAVVLAAVLGIPWLRALMGVSWPDPVTVAALAAVILAMFAWTTLLRVGTRRWRAAA